MNRYLRLLGSKSVIGAAGMALTWLASLPVIDIKHAVAAASGLLTVAGIRDALRKIEESGKKPGA